ncbi:MAG: response regulator [Pedobacter sp.]|uniref:response regulator transcription factor n=1 Tax=Pedobacter sp. TaxID=1411316 RepID=UPI00339A3B61
MEVKKIFIADDDEAIVDATAMMLEMAGYEVRHTLNGATVQNDVLNRPDLVLLDIWMSGIDGRDVCRMLKADPATLDIPVLMISAGRDIKESALASGANDFLAKPFDMDDLLEKVAKLIGN